jgi:hypothetical protein
MSRAAAEAVVRYFQGEPDQPAPAPDATPEEQREDVAEDAAASELDEIASEEEASGSGAAGNTDEEE